VLREVVDDMNDKGCDGKQEAHDADEDSPTNSTIIQGREGDSTDESDQRKHLPISNKAI